MSVAEECGPLPLARHRNVGDSSDDNMASAIPAIRHAMLLGLALRDQIHVFLSPIEDVAATALNGKTGSLTVTRSVRHRIGGVREYSRVGDYGRPGLNDDTTLGSRDREIDLGDGATHYELVGYFQLCDLLGPWTKSPVQLSDGAVFEQVVGDAECILQVIYVCNLVACLLTDE
jgi:hypothetical protein